MGSPVRGSIWKPDALGCRMPIGSDLDSAEAPTRIPPSLPCADALGGAEQPPLAFTQVLRISRVPSASSAMARTEVNRSMRTLMLISVTGVLAKSNVATRGDGLLSMNTRTRLIRRRSSSANRRVSGGAAGSGVLAGAPRVLEGLAH